MGGKRGAIGSILVAEDDHGFRGFVADALRADGHEVIEAGTGAEAIACAGRARPDLALLDVALPGGSGYEVCRQLREGYGDALPIMFMSGERVEPYDRMAGLYIGADDYLVKPFELGELLALVRKHLRYASPRRQSIGGPELTVRQLEVLRLLSEGLDQNAIAAELSIRPKTVGAHLERIFEKLDVHTRAQAVAHAYREHLLGAA